MKEENSNFESKVILGMNKIKGESERKTEKKKERERDSWILRKRETERQKDR